MTNSEYIKATKGALLILIHLKKTKPEGATITTLYRLCSVSKQHMHTVVPELRLRGLLIREGLKYHLSKKGEGEISKLN
jgi:DNA-binding IclR family transcriptional regulator